jgi:hypothetical protein
VMADDPKFETRADLQFWAVKTAYDAGFKPKRQLAALETIRRVTLAHVHLKG